jgi:hypothetical protein
MVFWLCTQQIVDGIHCYEILISICPLHYISMFIIFLYLGCIFYCNFKPLMCCLYQLLFYAYVTDIRFKYELLRMIIEYYCISISAPCG